jgi:hypothetical protein
MLHASDHGIAIQVVQPGGASRMTGVVMGCAKTFQDGWTNISPFNPANDKTSQSHEVSDAAGQVGD